ncbi:adenylyl-sulfate kinase [Archangium violaceum]|uniref:Adenylyl-sulfate kinase n=1 Tax=Archangium violaceum Cb vi76 TaxID=1406225 RepID=A0A084SUW8_9BACT|nr:adenylyl-sulfate kinase [Archangium violaceum]KFA92253.1 adenylylsulfate kinase [Archangium violaceum Cb vi76]
MAQTTGFTVWLTGMSGTGKSTMAAYIAARLRQVDRNVEILDENELRDDLWQGLGDSKDERNTIVRRLGYVAGLLTRNNVAVLVPCVSPYKAGREDNRRTIGRYIEVYVDCPTEKLIERDGTGRYKKALSGEIPNFIGITEPYEPPASAEVVIHSDVESVEDGAAKIFQSLLDLGYVTVDELKIITGKKMKAQPPTKTEVTRVSSAPAKPGKAAKAAPAPAAKAAAGKGAKARPAARAARVAKPAAKKAAAPKRKAR